MPADDGATRFVRSLLPDRVGQMGPQGRVLAGSAKNRASLTLATVEMLIGEGVLLGPAIAPKAGPDARRWLRAQKLEREAAAKQTAAAPSAAPLFNLDESPLARLAVAGKGEAEPFLLPHQVEAGERIRRLGERAQMQPRLTLSYDPARIPTGRGNGAAEIGDRAAEARRKLNRLVGALPRDCAAW